MTKYFNPIFPDIDFSNVTCTSCGQHLQFNYRSVNGTAEAKEHVGYFHRCSALKGSPFCVTDLLFCNLGPV